MLAPGSPARISAPLPCASAVDKTEATDDDGSLTGQFTWIIENFNKLKQPKLYSPVFQSGQYNWCVLARRARGPAAQLLSARRPRSRQRAGVLGVARGEAWQPRVDAHQLPPSLSDRIGDATPQAHPALPHRQQRDAALCLPRRCRLGDAAAGLVAAGALHADGPQSEGPIAQRDQRCADAPTHMQGGHPAVANARTRARRGVGSPHAATVAAPTAR